MLLVVILYCLGHNDKKSIYTHSIQTPLSIFFPNISMFYWLNPWMQNQGCGGPTVLILLNLYSWLYIEKNILCDEMGNRKTLKLLHNISWWCFKKNHMQVFILRRTSCFFSIEAHFYLKEWHTMVIPTCAFGRHFLENAQSEFVKLFQ